MGRKRGSFGKLQPRGARSASGRLRERKPVRVEPCDGVKRRHELYRIAANDVGDAADRHQRKGKMETDTCDALGRAYNAGLLGTGQRAQDLLSAGRKIASQYWRVYGFSTPDSLARFQPQRPSARLDPDKEKIIEDALNDGLDLVRARGRDVRRAFEQLVIDLNPDCGPAWLDQVVYAHRTKRTAAERDMTMLRLAVEGLEAIA